MVIMINTHTKKIEIYTGSILQIFKAKKIPKEKGPCKCLSIIMLGCVTNAKKKNYPQIILEQCKYEQEKTKMENLI